MNISVCSGFPHSWHQVPFKSSGVCAGNPHVPLNTTWAWK